MLGAPKEVLVCCDAEGSVDLHLFPFPEDLLFEALVVEWPGLSVECFYDLGNRRTLGLSAKD